MLLTLAWAPTLLHCRVVEGPPSAGRERAPVPAAREPERQPASPSADREPKRAPDPQPSEFGRVLAGPRYPFAATFSPLTTSVRDELRAITAKNPQLHADRFLKVGDSISKSPKFLQCFSRGTPEWGAHGGLSEEVRHFKQGGFDSFSRESLSAENGWSAWQPLHGAEPPLVRELSEVQGRYALVMFGTNDIETSRVSTFFRRLSNVVRTLSERGVISILSTIPERRDKQASRAKVPIFNAAIRALAQARKLPLVDLYQALSSLPDDGLTSDGVHPSAYREQGVVRACDLGEEGLRHGFNVKNWLTLQALARVRSVLANPELVEPAPPSPAGLGSQEEPLELVVPSVSSPAAPETVEAVPECVAKWEKQPRAAVTTYRLRVERDQAFEWLALDSETGEPLSFWIGREEQANGCQRGGRGFERFRLPRGKHRVRVVSPGVPHVLAVVASRTP